MFHVYQDAISLFVYEWIIPPAIWLVANWGKKNMTPQIWVGATITIVLFALSHAAATIWWMSRVNTTLSFIQQSMDKISDTLSKYHGESYSKAEAAKDFAVRDKEMAAIWRRVDAYSQHGGQNGMDQR